MKTLFVTYTQVLGKLISQILYKKNLPFNLPKRRQFCFSNVKSCHNSPYEFAVSFYSTVLFQPTDLKQQIKQIVKPRLQTSEIGCHFTSGLNPVKVVLNQYLETKRLKWILNCESGQIGTLGVIYRLETPIYCLLRERFLPLNFKKLSPHSLILNLRCVFYSFIKMYFLLQKAHK